jgi:predicted TIM-barrel fold metal-dependent hydrolase
MRDGFKIIDADRHVLEPSDLFAKYLPEKFRSRVDIQGPNQSYRRVDGELISDADRLRDATKQEDFGFTFAASKKWRETFADALAAKFDTASNVRDMDKEGVDIGVLFPTVGLYIMWRDNLDPELSAAICRAYNTWMSDYCSASNKRLYGVALIPLQDPVRAVEELQHAKKLGLVGIFWRPN